MYLHAIKGGEMNTVMVAYNIPFKLAPCRECHVFVNNWFRIGVGFPQKWFSTVLAVEYTNKQYPHKSDNPVL